MGGGVVRGTAGTAGAAEWNVARSERKVVRRVLNSGHLSGDLDK